VIYACIDCIILFCAKKMIIDTVIIVSLSLSHLFLLRWAINNTTKGCSLLLLLVLLFYIYNDGLLDVVFRIALLFFPSSFCELKNTDTNKIFTSLFLLLLNRIIPAMNRKYCLSVTKRKE